MGYDIIGDVHGQASKLEALLEGMGYRLKAGAFQHPHRKAIFVGDYIDRGPRQVDTYRIVRAMVESQNALAILGNHEFNAIAWHTADPAGCEDQHKPVFIGHYWLQGKPVLQGSKIACVDYSAGKGGPLVAYRWDGESELSTKNFFVAGGPDA